jgi:hypothetical protein
MFGQQQQAFGGGGAVQWGSGAAAKPQVRVVPCACHTEGADSHA